MQRPTIGDCGIVDSRIQSSLLTPVRPNSLRAMVIRMSFESLIADGLNVLAADDRCYAESRSRYCGLAKLAIEHHSRNQNVLQTCLR